MRSLHYLSTGGSGCTGASPRFSGGETAGPLGMSIRVAADAAPTLEVIGGRGAMDAGAADADAIGETAGSW